MRWGRWLVGAAIVVVGVVAIAPTVRDYVILHYISWTAPRPVANHPVEWAKGPAQTAATAGVQPPNIVLILADDLGFNDITFNGGGVARGAVPTPNIDAIGHQGVSFANGYAGNATCAPSRAALMTGRYPTRFGFEFTPAPAAFARVIGGFPTQGPLKPRIVDSPDTRSMPPVDAMGVPHSEITIARMLQGVGYHTLHLGKWHLGGAPGMRPEQQGFDESLGFINGASMYLPAEDAGVENSRQSFDPIDKFLWVNLPYSVQFNGSKPFRPKGYMTDYLTDQAVSAIDANKNRPFFLYLAYNAPHTPLQASKADYDALSQIKDHRLRVYAAMIRALDRGVGRVMAELKAQGLDNNTLVFFTSDNGGAHYIGLPEINRPFRGWKATFFEGGMHVPFFIRWPAQLPAGATYPAPVSHFDIFATAAAASGASLPKDRIIDGVNLLPFLSGKAAGRPHDVLFWRSGGYRTVLAGDWKLQTLANPERVWLYDLKVDPTERHDQAAANPQKVAELKAMLAEHDRQQVKPSWPALIEAPVYIDHPLGVRPRKGDEYIYWDN